MASFKVSTLTPSYSAAEILERIEMQTRNDEALVDSITRKSPRRWLGNRSPLSLAITASFALAMFLAPLFTHPAMWQRIAMFIAGVCALVNLGND